MPVLNQQRLTATDCGCQTRPGSPLFHLVLREVTMPSRALSTGDLDPMNILLPQRHSLSSTSSFLASISRLKLLDRGGKDEE